MKKNIVLVLIIFMLTISIIYSANDSQQFKQLVFSTDPRLQLPTAKDVQALKQGLVQHHSIGSQLHDLFGRYSFENNYCQSQRKLCKIGNISLVMYALTIPWFAWTDTQNFIKSLPVAACFIPMIMKVRNISQDYEHDQDILIQQCTQAFEQEDLETLQKFYEKEQQKNQDNQHHLKFLHKIMQRKKWVTEHKKD